jgi:hypothetical protein
MNDDAFRDIANAVMRLRHAFLRHGFEPPSAIELGSHENGDRLRYALPRDLVVAQPRMDKDDPEWCFDFQGVEFRYPAHWRSTKRGGREAV